MTLLKEQILNKDEELSAKENKVITSMLTVVFRRLLSRRINGQYTLFQNGRNFSILLSICKLALVALFKGKYSFEFGV